MNIRKLLCKLAGYSIVLMMVPVFAFWVIVAYLSAYSTEVKEKAEDFISDVCFEYQEIVNEVLK